MLIGALSSVVAFADLQADQQPTFRSEIDYVQVPVRVLDARGAFVPGLAQSDFQILEDGEPQAIAAFSEVHIPVVRSDRATVDGHSMPGEAVASNGPLQADGRVYVFVIDNQNMSAAVALRTRHVMRRFIEAGVGAHDLAAIVLTGSGRGQPLTRNPLMLYAAIDRLTSDTDPTGDAVDRVMQTIANTAQWMGTIKGRRKALVLMTPSSVCPLVNTDLRVFSNCNEAARYALRMAVQSDVTIYTIDPLGAVPTHGAPAEVAEAPGRRPAVIVRGPLDAARYLAEQSGGFAVVNSNSLDAGFARVIAEQSSYYLLGYYTTNSRADGKLRRNEVKVARPRVRAVHRPGYPGPPADAGTVGADLKVGTTKSVDEQLQRLVDNPLSGGAIPLRVAAAPFASNDSTASVAVVVEIPAGAVKSDGTGGASRMRLSIGFYDRDGKSVASADPTLEVSDMNTHVLRSVSWIAVPPGVYRLWVGAVETPGGISGTAMTDIEIPDFRQPRLTLSGLTVSTGATPIAGREFAAGSELFLYGEIYDQRSVRGTVRATVTITSTNGDVVYQTPFERISNTAGHQAYIPLKQLRNGAYVATVEAVSIAPARDHVSRSLAFGVSPQ